MAQAVVVDKCDLCDAEANVDYFCLNCKEILCSACKLAHSKSKKSREDIIILLSQARRDNLVHKSTVVFCSTHSTVELTLFCVKCDVPICTQCWSDKHDGHNITLLDKIKDSAKEELKKLITKLKEKNTVYDNAYDTAGQDHSQVSESIDKARKAISDQKRKIIEELNIVCDEQNSELLKLQQDEDKKYSKVCNKIQENKQTVTSLLQTAQDSLDNDNAALIVQSSGEAAHTLDSLEPLNIPQSTTVTYHTGDRGRANIRQVQGRVKVQHDIKPSGKLPQVKPNVQADKSDKQKHRQDVDKLVIDIKNLRVKSKIYVKGKGKIIAIVPLKNKTAWVATAGVKHLSFVDSAGNIIAESVTLDGDICDVKQYGDGFLVTCWNLHNVYKMSVDGRAISLFRDMSSYSTRGLCVTNETEVLIVCVQPYSNSKVVRLDRPAGNIIQSIKYDRNGAPLYNDPEFVTALTTGDIIVTDNCRIIGVDREGQHLYTWDGTIRGIELSHGWTSTINITHDCNDNLVITDSKYNRVFLLGKGGSGEKCVLDRKQGIDNPRGIAIDNEGQVWVSCGSGNILIIKY